MSAKNCVTHHACDCILENVEKLKRERDKSLAREGAACAVAQKVIEIASAFEEGVDLGLSRAQEEKILKNELIQLRTIKLDLSPAANAMLAVIDAAKEHQCKITGKDAKCALCHALTELHEHGL